MRYTKGKKGPESTNAVSVQFLRKEGPDSNPMAKGVMNVHLKKGNRMVSFIAQGRNAKDLLEAHAAEGDGLTLTMRWTGREAVTVTGVVEKEIAKAA